MNDDGPALLTIGQLARRTGLTVRTIRFWSDEGVLHPATRSDGGYRLYDAESVARLELIRTLRELGLGLDDVRQVVSGEKDIAAVAAAHVAALDAQIRVLRVNRAVLSTVAKRNSTTEETALMNRLARLSAAERKQIIDAFMEETFGGLDAADPDIRDRIRVMVPDLPDDPTSAQVDAWVELAELMQDAAFRAHMRRMIEFNSADRGPDVAPGSSLWFMSRLVGLAGEALERGVAPASDEADQVLRGLLGDADRAEALQRLEAAANHDVARFRDLVSLVRGLEPTRRPDQEFAWVVAALRAHPAG
ncbi:MerR family transcriptional regulator [Streptomyces sp. NPDC016845]|uniref:MerR family transcriptional regulator n=1 Tax=Streptomyces sp. NPDC016845 TaxID=3364972 RepID=UPI003788BA6E